MSSDVAIVGAGPAGAWTAYRLARAGARVTIFDPSHPREKPCGGGVTGRALDMVADAVDVSALESTPIRRARFGSATVPLDAGGLAVVSRRSFDAALLDAARGAGATHARVRVREVACDAHGAVIHTSEGAHRVAFLVGADGATSLVRRSLAQPFRRDQLSVAMGFYARGVTADEIVIEFVADPPGYLWSFPRPDHLAIGICAQADAGAGAASLRTRTAEWIRSRLPAAADARVWQAYSWPIPSLGADDFDAPVAGARWLLAGDAAGLVDPITREGISYALQSAEHAAAALAGDAPRAAYAARLRDDIVPELARAARLKAGFFTPPFVRLLVGALERSAPVRAVMADLVAGRQPYRTLKWRLLKTWELGLAWEAISVRNSRPAHGRALPAASR